MKQEFLIIFFLTIIFNSCSNFENKENRILTTDSIKIFSKELGLSYRNSSIELDSNLIPLKENEIYFPTQLFSAIDYEWIKTDSTHSKINYFVNYNKTDSVHLLSHSSFFHQMKEPLLYSKKLNKTVFRFSCLRVFCNPFVIRLEKNKEEIKLIWKISNNIVGYSKGTKIIEKIRYLSIEEFTELEQEINNRDFWNMKPGGFIEYDGETWLFEVATPYKYHLVPFHNPNRDENFSKICLKLLKLTDINMERSKYFK